ncbi:MAG: ribose-phosphate pyrophosphokinase [Planctomycetota bacterium]|nr:MAG: ribose-phosphate pyrophosphokinase [Planctomycetota bacterium]
MTPPLVASIPTYAPLARRLLEATGWDPCPVERRAFSDGETYQRLEVDVRGRDVVLVAGTPDESSTLLAYDLACALARYGARRLTWVLPYFGCQTMERAARPGEVVTAKTRARLLSTVPPTPLGTRFLLLDLHAAGIPFYFADDVTAFHLYAKDLALASARAFAAGDDLVLAAPDAGRAKWVQSLADDLGCPFAFAAKRRLGDGRTRVLGHDGEVAGKVVVIYDDMIRTGSTLLGAAEAFRAAGAARCYAVATHLVLPGDACERLLASELLDGIAGTDSHPRAELARERGAVVRSVAGLFAAWLTARPDGLLAAQPDAGGSALRPAGARTSAARSALGGAADPEGLAQADGQRARHSVEEHPLPGAEGGEA